MWPLLSITAFAVIIQCATPLYIHESHNVLNDELMCIREFTMLGIKYPCCWDIVNPLTKLRQCVKQQQTEPIDRNAIPIEGSGGYETMEEHKTTKYRSLYFEWTKWTPSIFDVFYKNHSRRLELDAAPIDLAKSRLPTLDVLGCLFDYDPAWRTKHAYDICVLKERFAPATIQTGDRAKYPAFMMACIFNELLLHCPTESWNKKNDETCNEWRKNALECDRNVLKKKMHKSIAAQKSAEKLEG